MNRLPLLLALTTAAGTLALDADVALGATRSFTDVGPATGTIITETHPSYDPGTQTLAIAGRVRGLTAAQVPNFRVLVQGIQGTLLYIGGNTASFSASIPLGETYLGGGAFPWWFPYAGAYGSDYHLAQPVLVELIDRNQKVHARSRVIVMDARDNPGFHSGSTGATVVDAHGLQLTENAFTALEDTHRSTLPYPSLTAFHGDVLDEIAALTPPPPMALTSGCFPIADDLRFQDTDAFAEAEAAAESLYLEYQFAKFVYDNAVEPAVKWAAWADMQAICVHDAPADHREDYQVCVGSLEGELTDAVLSGVEDATLVTTSGAVESEVVLGAIDGSVELRLRDVWIEGTERPWPGVCVRYPSAAMDNTEITNTEWLDEWATCDDAEIETSGAVQVAPSPFLVDIDPLEEEELAVTASGMAEFDLLGVVSRTGTQTCNQFEFAADALVYVAGLEPQLDTVITNAWQGSGGDSGQDAALDLLLRPLDVGTGPLTWYDAYMPFGFVDVRPNPGLRLRYDTSVAALEWTADGSAWAFEVYTPPFSSDGLDEVGDPFDLSYSVTTAFLTRVVASLADGFLDFDWAPTCAELGVDPAVWCGGDADYAPDLKGDLLAELSPGLAEIGGNLVSFHVTHEMTPFIWMHQDPPSPPAGEVPLVYDIPNLKITLSGEPYLGGATETVWLEAYFDFHDEDLQLSWTRASLGAPVGVVTVMQTALTGCGRVLHTDSPRNDPTSCERTLEADLYGLLAPEITRRAQGMVEEFPGPHEFDAEGEGAPGMFPAGIQLRWQQDNYVAMYGTLE